MSRSALDLSANLLAGPSGGVDGAVGVVAVASDLSNHGHNPVLTIVLVELAVREGIGKIAVKRLVM